MPKRKQDFNTIYISERLQEALRPISRCALTSVVAPMGYGKTTAVNWYLAERRKEENARIIRISVYSDNLAIFWKSVQDAFLRAGLSILLDYPCPTDAAGGSLLADDLCHALAGEKPCYLFIDDFHLLTDVHTASLHAGEPSARKCACHCSKPRPFPALCGTGTSGRQALSAWHGRAASEPCRACRLCTPLWHCPFGCRNFLPALYE